MKPEVQNKITLDKFFVESLNYQCDNYNKVNSSDQMDIELGVASSFSNDNLKSYLIKIIVNIKMKNNDFKLDCVAVGQFSTSEKIDDEFKDSHFVKINSPAILFPFVRSYINTMTTNSGLTPIILPAFNFSNLHD